VATTTNFGWTTPDNTGYVKDGALAIRTLGNAIDTSIAELKGGTTGQVLKKTSGTDMDFEWGTISSTPRIGQVVQTVATNNPNTTSTSYVDVTSQNVTITPSLNTSKVLVSFSFVASLDYYWADSPTAFFQILRGSTVVYSPGSVGVYTASTVNGYTRYQCNFEYLDSPATTSATTYKLQWKVSGANTPQVQLIPSSTITAQEVLV